MARLCPVFFPGFCRRPKDKLGAVEQHSVGGMEKPVIAHLVKSRRQDMLQKPAHEFHDWQGHDTPAMPPLLLVLGGFPVPESRLIVLNFQDAIVGNEDPVDIAAEVLHNVIGSLDCGFGVNHPVLFPSLSGDPQAG